MNNNLPVACVISSENFFTNKLTKQLKDKGCLVRNVITANDFRNYFPNNFEGVNYIFLVDGILEESSFLSLSNLKELFAFIIAKKIKTQIVLPYVVSERERERVENIVELAKGIDSSFLEIFYLGEIVDERMSLTSDHFLSHQLKLINDREGVRIPSFDFSIYLSTTDATIKTLLKGMFSYGFDKREIVIANKFSVFNFLKKVRAFSEGEKYVNDSSLKPESTVSCFDFYNVSFDEGELQKVLMKAVHTKKKAVFKKPKLIHPKLKVYKVKNKASFRKYFLAIFVFFWILSLPFLSFLMSTLSLKQGFKDLLAFNTKTANIYFNIAKATSSFSRSTLFFYLNGKEMSRLINGYSDFGIEAIKVADLGEKIVNESKGGEGFDISGQSKELSLGIDSLYREFSFLQADKEDFGIDSFLPNDFNFREVSYLLSKSKDLVLMMPEVLGNDKKTNYVVLVQDSKDIWPSGGRISSFGVLSFDKGALVDKNFFDTAPIDLQLKGHVDPPFALSKYFGITDWRLGESNWETPFADSAKRAQWFLQNEINQPSDGVIAVSQNAFDDINNYEKGFLGLVEKTIGYLSDKDIQIFLNKSHDNKLMDFNWDGGVNFGKCFGNCAALGAGLVEASVDKSQISAAIERTAKMRVDFNGNRFYSTLEVDLTNTSKTDNYRTYLRAIAPKNAKFGMVNEIGEKSTYLSPDINLFEDRSEGGVLVKVTAQTTQKVIFTWENDGNLDFSKKGEILFYFRKQPGIGEMKTQIDFGFPSSLTVTPSTSYNTDLKQDFQTTINYDKN